MQDGGDGIGGDIPSDMHAFEVCLWFSTVNLVTAGFGALVSFWDSCHKAVLQQLVPCSRGQALSISRTLLLMLVCAISCDIVNCSPLVSRYPLADTLTLSAQPLI